MEDILVVRRFAKAFFYNKLLTLKWLFFAADVRGGMGERRLFRICMQFLAVTEPQLAEKLIPLIPEYTRWDNLLCLLETPLKETVCQFLKNQLDADMGAMKEGQSIGLCAKWMPSVNATSARAKTYAKTLIQAFGMTAAQYRRMLSALRAYLKIVEVDMSKKNWTEIDYSAVPSRANLLYEEAFLRNDKARRTEYLEKVESGEEKIHAGVLFPHDIVQKYVTDDFYSPQVKPLNATLEELWKALPDYVEGAGNVICVADGSGSMSIRVGGSNTTCLAVANALAIYFAERATGVFHDCYLTFSDKPQLVDFSHCKSLRDKIATALLHDEVENTNIEAVFKLLLKTAVQANMRQEDMPRTVLILSDMEFDMGVDFPIVNGESMKHRLFEQIAERYAAAGYKLPRLVFWNICSRSLTVPLRQNELGVALVSGFSPTTVKMVLSGKLDPLECLLEQLNSDRYAPVQEALRGLL
jgi:hypothetical protein